MAVAVNVTIWRKERPSRAAGINEDFMRGEEGCKGIGDGKSQSKGTQ